MNPNVNDFFSKAEKWQDEMEKLRFILLDCILTEDLKWGQLCYVYHDTNIAIIGALKDCCVLSFFKGVLLNDPDNLLVQPGENSQSVRFIPFTSVQQINDLEPVLKAYIYEAIEVEKAGVKVVLKKTEDYPVPEEFQHKLDAMPALKTAYEALTPGRQRAYLLHFAQPKQAKTREARIEKYIPLILSGKGLLDDYLKGN